MRLHHAAGRLAHAKVAIFRIAAKPAVEILLAQMTGDECVLAPRLGFGFAFATGRARRAPGRVRLAARIDNFGFALGFALAMSVLPRLV